MSSTQDAGGSSGADAKPAIAPQVIDVGAIAFDLDGTLLDTIHDLAAACNALLAELEHPRLPVDEIREMVGKGMSNLVGKVLSRASGDRAYAADADATAPALARYQLLYATQLGRDTKPFPGTLEGLLRLACLGIPLAVITNKATRFVRPHLAQAGIEHFFTLVIGGDDLPTKKPHPGPLLHVAKAFGIAPSQLLMIGDSGNDAVAARAAGCPVLIVPYGYNEGHPVQDLDADGIVATVDAVADRVRYVPSTSHRLQ